MNLTESSVEHVKNMLFLIAPRLDIQTLATLARVPSLWQHNSGVRINKSSEELTRTEILNLIVEKRVLATTSLEGSGLDELIRSPDVDLSSLSTTALSSLLTLLKTKIASNIRQAALLSGYDQRGIQHLAIDGSSEYSRGHFGLLLREIIFKRRSLLYYIKWLVAKSRDPNTGEDVTNLLRRAALGVITPGPTEHTSPMFTAYSGFLLLANSEDQDTRAVLDTLKLEGASEEGLKLAGVLLGALVGT